MRQTRKYKRPASRFAKVLTAFVMLIVVLCAAAIILPSYIDWNRFKDAFEAQASAFTGRKVTIEGAIQFSLLPRPALSLQKVTVASIEGAANPVLLGLAQLDAKLGVQSLLSGKFQITEFHLVEPVLNLEVLSDGRNNWTLESVAGAQPTVRFDQITIKGGRIRYQNAVSGDDVELAAMNMQLSAGSLQGPFAATGTLHVQSAPVSLDATLGLRTNKTPSPLKIKADLGNGAAVDFTGNLSHDNQLAGALSAQGQDLNELLLAVMRIGGAPASQALSIPANLPYQIESNVTGNFTSFQLEKIRLNLGKERLTGNAGFNEKTQNLDITLAASNLDLDALRASFAEDKSAKITGTDAQKQFAIPGNLAGRIKFSAASIKLNNGNVRDFNISLAITEGVARIETLSAQLPGSTAVQISGAAGISAGAPRISGQLELKSENLRGLISWLDVKLPMLSDRRLTRGAVITQFKWTENLAEFTGIEAEVDATRLTGNLAISSGMRLAIGVDMEIDQLNADSYVPEVSRTVERETPIDGINDAAPDYSKNIQTAMDQFDCNFKLSFKSLTYRNTPITQLEAQGALIDGALALTHFSVADVAGSAISMSGVLSRPASGAEGEINFRLASNDLSGLVRAFGASPPIAGSKLGTTLIEARLLIANAALEATIDSRFGESFLLVTGKMDGLAPGIVAPVGTPPVLAAHLLLGSSSLAKFSALLGHGLTPTKAEDAAGINLNADLMVTPEQINLSALTGTIGSVPVKGNLVWRKDGPKPVVTGEFSAGEIMMDNFIAPEAGDVSDASPPNSIGQLPWSGAPLELTLLDKIEGEVKLEAARLNLSGYDIVKPALVLMIGDGQAKLQQFTGTLWQGAATATASLRAAGTPELTADWKLERADMQMASSALGERFPLTGRLDFSGSVKGAGASTFALIADLKGQAQLSAQDGTIQGIDLAAFSEGLSTLNKTADFLNLAGSVLQGGETAYQRIDVPFVIHQGIAQTTDPVIAIAGVSGDLQASIDLPRYWMNAEAEFKLNAHADAPPIGIAFSGPLNNPERSIRTDKLENFFTTRLMSQSLQRIIDKTAAPPPPIPQSASPAPSPQAAPEPEPEPEPEAKESPTRKILNSILDGIGGKNNP